MFKSDHLMTSACVLRVSRLGMVLLLHHLPRFVGHPDKYGGVALESLNIPTLACYPARIFFLRPIFLA